MKKTKWLVITTILFIILINGIIICSYDANDKEPNDFKQSYTYAIIQRYDGEQKIEVSSWIHYRDEWWEITDTSGNVYFVSPYNTILIREK